MSAVLQRVQQRHAQVPGQLDLFADDDPDEPLCPACDEPDVHRTRTGWFCGTCAVSWRGPDDR